MYPDLGRDPWSYEQEFVRQYMGVAVSKKKGERWGHGGGVPFGIHVDGLKTPHLFGLGMQPLF